MKLSPSRRKALLTLHVITSVGWLGVDLLLLALGIAGLAGADPAVVYPAAGLIGTIFFAPLAVVVWVVGVADAVLSPWGLFRHWWVVVKLILTTVMLVLVVFLLLPTLRRMGDVDALTAHRRADLVVPPAISSTLLIIATVLSTYKPWGRRVKPPAPGRAPRAAGAPTPGARSGPAGTRTGTAARVPTA